MALPDTAWSMKLSRAFILRTLSVKVYDPATDTHAAGTACKGFRDEKTVGVIGVGESGQVTKILSNWTLTELASRPLQRSIIVDPDTSEEWVIDKVREHEPDDLVWDCETHLLPTDA